MYNQNDSTLDEIPIDEIANEAPIDLDYVLAPYSSTKGHG